MTPPASSSVTMLAATLTGSIRSRRVADPKHLGHSMTREETLKLEAWRKKHPLQHHCKATPCCKVTWHAECGSNGEIATNGRRGHLLLAGYSHSQPPSLFSSKFPTEDQGQTHPPVLPAHSMSNLSLSLSPFSPAPTLTPAFAA